MANQISWDKYNLIQWDGSPIENGALIALRTTQYNTFQTLPDGQMAVGCSEVQVNLSSFANILSYQPPSTDSLFDYVAVSESSGTEGCVFQVTTWPLLPNENAPGQKIILQAPNGKYLQVESCLAMFAASVDEDEAQVFIMQVENGNQINLYPDNYNYGQRTEIEPGLCAPGQHFANGIYCAYFRKAGPNFPILLGLTQGIPSGSNMEVFLATLK